MNKYLEQLVELSSYDKEIDSYEIKLRSSEKILSNKKNQIQAEEQKIETLEKEISELKSQILLTNAHISEQNKKLKSSEKKSSFVKNERELKALDVEDGIAKEKLNTANEEIAKLEKIVSNKETFEKEAKENLQKLQNELDEISKQAGIEISKLQDDQGKIKIQKEILTKNMNPKILSFYEKVKKWAKNTAVVPVRKQACYGCFMRLNDKTYSSVIRSDDIVTCPHCGRILYKEVEQTK